MFAYDSKHRSQLLLDLQNRTTMRRSHLQHLLSTESLASGVYLDLSFDEIFNNIIDRPAQLVPRPTSFTSIIDLANCFASTSSPRHQVHRLRIHSLPHPPAQHILQS